MSQENSNHIVACINGVPPSDSVMDYAAWIAKASSMGLKLLHTLNHQDLEQTSDLSGNIGLGARSGLLNELVEIEHEQNKLLNRKAKLILEAAKERVEKMGVSDPKLCLRNGRLIENLQDLQKDISLAVIGRYGQKHQDNNAPGVVGHKVEGVVRSLERPVLVVSQPFTEPKSTLLAFDGSKAANNALSFVQNHSMFQKMEIHIVYKGDKTDKSVEFLSHAMKTLTDKNLNVKTAHLDGAADDAILSYLDQNSINMMVMGAYGHNWIHDIIMGSFTSKVLAKNEMPLLLVPKSYETV